MMVEEPIILQDSIMDIPESGRQGETQKGISLENLRMLGVSIWLPVCFRKQETGATWKEILFKK